MEDRASLYEISRNSLGTKKENGIVGLVTNFWKTKNWFSHMLMVRSLWTCRKAEGLEWLSRFPYNPY
jgi:hypothetical protein